MAQERAQQGPERPPAPETPSRGRILITADLRGGTHGVDRTLTSFEHQLQERGYIVDSVSGTSVAGQELQGRHVKLPFHEDVQVTIPSLEDVRTIVTHLQDQRPDVILAVPEGTISPTVILAAKLLAIPVVGLYTTDLVGYMEKIADPASPTVKAAVATILHAIGLSEEDLPPAGQRFLQQVKEGTAGFLNDHKEGIVLMGERILYALTDIVIVPSEKAKRQALRFGLTEDKIIVVPRGIDKELFATAQDNPYEELAWYQDYQLTHKGENPTIILSLGRISPEKNWRDVVEAAKHFHDIGQDNVHFVFIGPFGSPQEERDFYDVVREYHLEGLVHAEGKVSPEKTPAWYQYADVHVTASDTETHGHTPREALASGTPVVSVAGEPTADCIEEAITGNSYRKGNTISLVDAITQTIPLKEEGDTDRFKQAVDSRVRSWEEIGEELVAIIEDLRVRRSSRRRTSLPWAA